MLAGYNPIVQAFLGTLLTWGLTALGSGLVVVFSKTDSKLQRKLLDGSLGYAAGVMLAASYFSLLAPAVESAESSGVYGAFSFIPVVIGFALGSLFVQLADYIISKTGVEAPLVDLANATEEIGKRSPSPPYEVYEVRSLQANGTEIRHRHPNRTEDGPSELGYSEEEKKTRLDQWKRILLLIVAITVHNIPEGLAVGVGFGAIGTAPGATLENARNLAIGIGIQNFPEGLAVSLPLRAAGFSTFKSFWYGQLSGIVEPIAGVLGAAAVQYMTPLLPYALSFAAGAMIFVVFDDILPEARNSGNSKLATWMSVFGFVTMMSLDVGLG